MQKYLLTANFKHLHAFSIYTVLIGGSFLQGYNLASHKALESTFYTFFHQTTYGKFYKNYFSQAVFIGAIFGGLMSNSLVNRHGLKKSFYRIYIFQFLSLIFYLAADFMYPGGPMFDKFRYLGMPEYKNVSLRAFMILVVTHVNLSQRKRIPSVLESLSSIRCRFTSRDSQSNSL